MVRPPLSARLFCTSHRSRRASASAARKRPWAALRSRLAFRTFVSARAASSLSRRVSPPSRRISCRVMGLHRSFSVGPVCFPCRASRGTGGCAQDSPRQRVSRPRSRQRLASLRSSLRPASSAGARRLGRARTPAAPLSVSRYRVASSSSFSIAFWRYKPALSRFVLRASALAAAVVSS